MKQQIGRLLSTLLLATFSLGITAGVIQGTIIDKQTKEPLTGATVQIAGTTTGTVADVEGNYTLTLSNGTYTIEVKYIGYKTLRMNEVKVKANATLNFELEVDAQTLDAVTVVARKNPLRIQRTAKAVAVLDCLVALATLAIENMGAKEMTLKGISNVQDGVKKITGISIASAGQLIVRGLGDRYSTTTLNGLPIASPNPDNKLIPLDLFPASTVKNITVSKVYAAGAFADYSGAHIDISTKENTGSDFFSIGFNVGGRFNTVGKDFYYSDRKGGLFSTGNLRNKDRILVDPFCGSGTFPIEAAMMAANIAPGMNRSFTAESWMNIIPKKVWYDTIDEANDLIQDDVEVDIQGYDLDSSVIKIARRNAREAGVDHLIHFQERDVKDLHHPKKYGFVITNPPYGERLEDKKDLPALYRAFGESFKHLDSWSAYMITSYEEAERYFGRKADKNRKIYNGMLKTYFYQFLGPKPPKKPREK